MRRHRVMALILCAAMAVQGCRGLFRGGSAKQNAVQALVTVTGTADALMTLAGIAYDAGAFGAPGSDRAEDTWDKIALQSMQLHAALTAWTAAIKAGESTTTYQWAVTQALAILTAVLPPSAKKQSALSPAMIPRGMLDFAPPVVSRLPPLEQLEKFGNPDSFRSVVVAGGSR